MLTKITRFVKAKQDEIVLIIAVVLISLLSFSLGYISAVNDAKKPIKIEKASLTEIQKQI
ncbi:MAG: hypothetical protein WC520_01805 [Candidatus Paceibacterota bacterium]